MKIYIVTAKDIEAIFSTEKEALSFSNKVGGHVSTKPIDEYNSNEPICYCVNFLYGNVNDCVPSLASEEQIDRYDSNNECVDIYVKAMDFESAISKAKNIYDRNCKY